MLSERCSSRKSRKIDGLYRLNGGVSVFHAARPKERRLPLYSLRSRFVINKQNQNKNFADVFKLAEREVKGSVK